MQYRSFLQYHLFQTQPMLHSLSVVCLAVLIVVGFKPAALSSETDYPREIWLGMYMGQVKIGYTSITQDKIDYQDQPAIVTESTSRTQMTVLGTQMSQDIRTTIYSTLEADPLYQEFEMSSGGKTTQVYATFKSNRVECRLVTDSGESTKTIPIPEGTRLMGDSYGPVFDGELKVGMSFTRKSFNPLTLTLDDVTVTVEREEVLEFEGQDIKTMVVQTKSPISNLTTFQSVLDRQAIRIESPAGIVMLREPRVKAMAMHSASYEPPTDFAVLTSVRANVDLPNPNAVKSLDIRLSGIPEESFILEDGRQRVYNKAGDESFSVTYLIRAKEFAGDDSALLPITHASFEKYLNPGHYVESDADTIIRRARSIIGREKNAYNASQLIREWINLNMKPVGKMGILRPATDVLANREGVCRDYAVLFAALARSVGIPTRVVGGLTFINGNFYYHAWNEVWTGQQWVPFDSTLNMDFVDATHIKLTEGDATDMFRIGRIIGQLEAEILAYE